LRHSKYGKSIPILALSLLPGACEQPILGPCNDEWVPAVIVDVYDAMSGQPAAAGARGFVLEGTYSDSLRLAGEGARVPGPAVSLYAAWERPGTYDVYLIKDGFVPWTRRNVQAPQSGCHPATARLRAELVPAP
jgi:hypothetical protein